ncbi:MAG: hypothetical protein K9W45_03755 [Candidatus Heimdallarchaeum aukensis]|uniref:Uncharacterized protein n=1 Tax=Candidatus Heimdallarchaeum aukensis TaxID=2876573 RepID=A0A9Y1BML9_9ARCH|nr:MAG: hypothetical protein K9W45_03755 [Candidatus Heimdallarchaeum aukensis]
MRKKDRITQPEKKEKIKVWQIILIFGFLQSTVTAIGTYFFDFFAGSATVGFGKMGEIEGTGMFFVYMVGYFNALIIILPILKIRQFGMGTAIYLPYAIIGFFVEYYYELIKTKSLVSPWAVVGWCVFGLATGFSADLSFKFLPSNLNLRNRTILTGIIMGLTNFILTLVALTFFYVNPQTGSGSFLGIAYFGLPWLLVNSAFGGYTAYAISKKI